MTFIQNIIHSWKQRGLIKEITDTKKLEILIEQKLPIYCGFDPTSFSLHIGHLVPLTLLRELSELGCPIIVVLGGATSQIGDPSFRTRTRTTIAQKELQNNLINIQKQIHFLLPQVQIVNNASWYANLSLVNFLDQVGGLFTVNKMLERKGIRKTYSQNGLTFKEFSYILLQAYDFYHLWKEKKCHGQIGGSDQFPNIAFGLDMIKKLNTSIPTLLVGLTTNLLVRTSGNKFSKTDTNSNLWLDKNMISPYDFCQFIYNLSDTDVKQWGQIFLPTTKQTEFQKLLNDSHSRPAQKFLMNFLGKWIYGKITMQIVKNINQIFHKWTKHQLLLREKIAFSDLKYLANHFTVHLLKDLSSHQLVNVLIELKIVNSRSRGRRLIEQKGIQIWNQTISDLDYKIESKDAIKNFVLLKKGKNKYFLLSLK